MTDANLARVYDEAADATGFRQGDTAEGDEARHAAGLRAVAIAAYEACERANRRVADEDLRARLRAERKADKAKAELAKARQ